MKILGIETSCDETAAAVLEQKYGRIQILSNIVASSASIQTKYGGIIPEQAAREQIKSIIPVIKEALQQAGCGKDDLDAIAVTQGPGLVGSLLVGVETAKVLSLIWQKPLIPVNHLLGHFYANWISTSVDQKPIHRYTDTPIHRSTDNTPTFPFIGLLVSGGHTDLVLFKSHAKYEYLGGTRDDAAGECFDKCARLLNLPYPGGPQISKLAQNGNPTAFNLPRPMLDSKDFDFSFSGLKTAVANLLLTSEVRNNRNSQHYTSEVLANLCASIEAAIIEVLVDKTIKAARTHHIEQIIVAGGVAANQKLINDLRLKIKELKLNIKLFAPPPHLCTDNGAMIAARAFFEKPTKNPLNLQANPNLSLAY